MENWSNRYGKRPTNLTRLVCTKRKTKNVYEGFRYQIYPRERTRNDPTCYNDLQYESPLERIVIPLLQVSCRSPKSIFRQFTSLYSDENDHPPAMRRQ